MTNPKKPEDEELVFPEDPGATQMVSGAQLPDTFIDWVSDLHRDGISEPAPMEYDTQVARKPQVKEGVRRIVFSTPQPAGLEASPALATQEFPIARETKYAPQQAEPTPEKAPTTPFLTLQSGSAHDAAVPKYSLPRVDAPAALRFVLIGDQQSPIYLRSDTAEATLEGALRDRIAAELRIELEPAIRSQIETELRSKMQASTTPSLSPRDGLESTLGFQPGEFAVLHLPGERYAVGNIVKVSPFQLDAAIVLSTADLERQRSNAMSSRSTGPDPTEFLLDVYFRSIAGMRAQDGLFILAVARHIDPQLSARMISGNAAAKMEIMAQAPKEGYTSQVMNRLRFSRPLYGMSLHDNIPLVAQSLQRVYSLTKGAMSQRAHNMPGDLLGLKDIPNSLFD